jgi:hypothetical protein
LKMHTIGQGKGQGNKAKTRIEKGTILVRPPLATKSQRTLA